MENNKQMKKIEKIIAICMFAFVVVFALATFSFIQVGRVKRKNARYDEFIAALEKQEQDLKSGINNRKQDEYLNNTARDQLGMIKDGEIIYRYE